MLSFLDYHFHFIDLATSGFAFCLPTNNLPDGLQNLSYRYPGYATSYGFIQCGDEEKWMVVSFLD